MKRFENKVVFITGAGQGLGAAYARAFAAEEATVILAGRTYEKVKKVEEEISLQGGRAFAVKCDVSVYEEVKGCVEEVLQKFGQIDVLINNAAVERTRALLDVSPEEWSMQIDTNLSGTFYCCHEIVPHMVERKYGKVINVSSGAANHVIPGFGAYTASKGGVTAFSNVLAEEVKKDGVNVNSIYLGLVNSDSVRERYGKDPTVVLPPDEMMQMEEVTKTILFLASDDAKYFIGSAVEMYGMKY